MDKLKVRIADFAKTLFPQPLRSSNWKLAIAYALNPEWDRPKIPLLPAAKTEVQADGYAFYGLQVLKELKNRTGIYLAFVSSDFVVCAVCGMKVRVWNFGDHVEGGHFQPPQKTYPRHKRSLKLF
jgi:hypothetical protein